MSEAKNEAKKPRGMRVTVPADVVVEMEKFSAETGVKIIALKDIVGEAAFGLIRGNVGDLWKAKVFGGGAAALPSSTPEEAPEPAVVAGRPRPPMGT